MRIRLLVLALVVVALPRAAFAVCLLGDYSVKAEYDRSVAVVTGQVIAERSVPESLEYYAGTMYTVMIDESYRGQLSGSVDVFDENSSGRFPLQVGSRYLLFIDRELGQLVVDNCGNSGLVSDKADVLQTVRQLRSADSTFSGQTQGDRLVQQLRGLPTPPPAPRSDGTVRETDQRRADVMRQLRQLGDEALPALARGLSDPDVSIRRNVAIALIRLGMGLGGPKVDIRNCLPALIAALQDRDRYVRAWAAQAIGQIGAPAAPAVPALVQLLKDSDEGSRNSACLALRGIGPAAKDALPALRQGAC